MRNLAEYHRPTSLAEVLALLGRTEVRTVPLAGGTDLVGRASPAIQAVVDLRDLGLSYIREDGSLIRIGATTTLQELVNAPLLHDLASGLIARTAHTSATSLIRNMATIGGTLISAATTADLPPVLLALDAQLALYTPDPRQISLAHFYESYPNPLAKGGLLTEITVARPAVGSGAAYHKVGRTPADAPILGVAVVLAIANGTCRHVSIAVGGIQPVPVRLVEAEQWLMGHQLDEQLIRQVTDELPALLDPQSDFRASRQYRKRVCAVLAQRALLEALTHANNSMKGATGST